MTNLFELHGKQDQNKRTAIYFQFVEKKQACLFCTDIAARGVDFPAVDWVVQVDLPEDVNTYVHRVGRTARYKAKGNALIFMSKEEEGFLKKLEQKQILVKNLRSRANVQLTIQPVLEKMNAENKDLQHLAKRACVSYLRSIHLKKDKSIFNVSSIDTQKLAWSYGLLNAPKVEIVKGSEKMSKTDRIAMLRAQSEARKLKNTLDKSVLQKQEDSSDSEEMFAAKARSDDSDDDNEDLFKPKTQETKTTETKLITNMAKPSKK